LHIRLLSLRPALAAYVAAETSEEGPIKLFGGILASRVAMQCSIMCVNVAQETIDLAFTRLSADPTSVGPTAAWWYNVMFVYSAATVLVAAKLCASLMLEFSDDSISSSWSRAIELLGYYRDFNPIIEQLIRTLHMLYDVLPEHYLQARELSGPSMRSGQAFESDDTGPTSHQLPLELRGDQTSHSDVSQANTATGLGLSTMLSDRMALYSELDFSFDSNDFSWLNAMPFDM
jgi:hypothetical protein